MSATQDPRPGHARCDTHPRPAGSDPSVIDDHASPDSHYIGAVDDTLSTGSHASHGAESLSASGGPSCDPTNLRSAPNEATPGRTLAANHPAIHPTQPTTGSSDGWLELRIWAEMFDDAQKSRIANVNRAESPGVDPVVYEAHIELLRVAEHQCRLAMRRCLRRVAPKSILDWQKASNGIGIDLLARLLGHMGHPVWATPHHWEGTGANRVLVTDPPFNRTVGQLWQFAGHGAPGRKWKGMTADDLAAQGNPKLKMLVHLNAEACMKCMTSPYRLVYEQSRLSSVDKVHTAECVRCGPSGKPAQIGSPWSPGHQHAHALRIVGKEILRDLWIVAGGAA